MEAAKCKLCGERHYGLCPSLQAEVQKPLKRIKEAAVAKLRGKTADRIVIDDPGYSPTAASSFWEDIVRKDGPAVVVLAKTVCEACEARRLKQLEAQKRYRAKKPKA